MKRYIYTACSFLLLGCGTTLEPMTTYNLAIDNANISKKHTKYSSIQVTIPKFLQSQNSRKIFYAYDNLHQDSYLNSQWSDALGRMLSSKMLIYLDNSKLFKDVTPYNSDIDTRYRLDSIVYDISQHIQGKESFAILDIKVMLIDNQTSKIVKSKHFRYKQKTNSVDAKGFVEAINQLLNKMCQDIVGFL